MSATDTLCVPPPAPVPHGLKTAKPATGRATTRLTYLGLHDAAWAKGWELYQQTRRGHRGYFARPAWCAIFAREEASVGFYDLKGAARWLPTCPEPIAYRWDFDLWKAMRARRVAA